MTLKKGTLEFLTIATEFCAFIEKAEHFSKKDFIEKSQKIISLLYLKAILLEPNSEIDGYCEQIVTEDDWNFIKDAIELKLGSHEGFVDVMEPDNYENSESIQVSISECFADIYQDLREFVERFNDTNDETQELAIFECSLNFKMYWGPRAIAILKEFHSLLFATNSTIEEEEE